jgi:hypothetical protein
MEAFLNYPLYLDVDDPLIFKLRVKNVNGWSNYTPDISEVKVKSKPQVRVSFLQKGQKTNSKSIHIMWPGITSSPANGGINQTDYTVYWSKGDVGSQWTALAYFTNGATQIETKDYTWEELSTT